MSLTRHLLTVALITTSLDFGGAPLRATDADLGWRSRFGIVAFDLKGGTRAKLAALGVGVIRGSCGWSVLEPARGVYDWRCADDVIVGAQRQGLRTYMTVNCTPSWASGAAVCERMPRDVVDWYDFVTRFVARYSGYDTILGVWNEPNLSLPDDPTGEGYALLFVNASNARNRVDSRFTLAGPDTSHHAIVDGYYEHVMDRITSMRAWNPQDVVAVHWYPDGPPLLGYMDLIHSAAGTQDVWLSETGYSAADFSKQADFYDAVIGTFVGSGRPWWTHLVFYRLWDGRDCCSEAILRGDYSAKPAFTTFRRWIAGRDHGGQPGPNRRPLG